MLYIKPPQWGHVAEWLRNGLQNRVHQFNSGRGLHLILLISHNYFIRHLFRQAGLVPLRYHLPFASGFAWPISARYPPSRRPPGADAVAGVASRPVLVEWLELGRKGARWGSGAVRWTESNALSLAS
jgi:hypothetical protein